MLNGKHVTNGVTNGVTAKSHMEVRLEKAEKDRLRKRRQRTKQRNEKMIERTKTVYEVQADGSCIHKWPHGPNFYFSPRQWTTYCKLLAIGATPLVVQIERPGKKPELEISVVTAPMGKPDDRWLKACENDPNRDAVQITVN